MAVVALSVGESVEQTGLLCGEIGTVSELAGFVYEFA
jgi:hypothetical protein